MGVLQAPSGHSLDKIDSEYGDVDTPISATDESCPFLSEGLEDAIKLEDRLEDGTMPTRRHGVTPLPVAQLATLCAVRLVDPIMFTQIFPYVNELIDHLHLTEDRSKTGLYSGIVVRSLLLCKLSQPLTALAGKQLCYLTAALHLPLGADIRYVVEFWTLFKAGFF